MSSMGERIKKERIRLGLSREEAAAEGDIHLNVQGRYERNESVPSAAYLEALSLVGMDVNYVITGVRASAGPINKTLLTALMKRVLSEAEAHPSWNLQAEQIIPAIYERIILNLKPDADIQVLVDNEVDYVLSVLRENVPPKQTGGQNVTVSGDKNRVAGRDYTEKKGGKE